MAKSRGNILFLILLAVVLFAALSYAVTSSMRGGGSDSSNEQAQTMASQILQYTSLIENTIMRSQVMNSIPDYGWDVVGANSFQTTANNTCASTNCRLFTTSTREGLMISQPAPARAFTDPVTNALGRANFRVSSVINIGTNAEDVVVLYSGLTQKVCEAINKQLGIQVDLTVSDVFGGTTTFYNGTLTSMPVSGSVIGDTATDLAGKPAACFFLHPDYGFFFYRVIIAR